MRGDKFGGFFSLASVLAGGCSGLMASHLDATPSPGTVAAVAPSPAPSAVGEATTPSPSPGPSLPPGLALAAILGPGDRGVTSAVPFDLVTLVGSGFRLEPPSSYSVRFGPIAVARPLVIIRDDRLIVVAVPRGFKRGQVSVATDAQSAASSRSFTEIASLSLSPREATLAPGESKLFSISAYDADGAEIDDPNVPWGMLNEKCLGTGCEDNDAAKVRSCLDPRFKVCDGDPETFSRLALATGELDVGDMVIHPDGTRTRVSKPGEMVARGEILAGNLAVAATGSIVVRIPG